jgi:GNAT superfamily N-acetyltransferase
MRRFQFRVVTQAAVTEAGTFYDSQHDEHLWPRTTEELAHMAEEGELFCCEDEFGDAVTPEHRTRIVAACYLKAETHAYEFGGVCVSPSVRGHGVGTFLGQVAIATVLAQSNQVNRLIAHVHEDNELPRHMLARMGFQQTSERVVADDAPASMRRNSAGKVVGDVFRFEEAAFATLADHLEGFHGQLSGKAGLSSARVQISQWQDYKPELIEALRALASM